MKHAILPLSNYIQSAVLALADAANSIYKAMVSAIKALIAAKERQTNHTIALQLWKTEYRNQSFEAVLHAVNKGSLDDLK